MPYEGERGVRALMQSLIDRFGWLPIMEGDTIIALRRPEGEAGGTVSLEPGGQFELSGDPLQSVHQVAAETQAHLDQCRQVGAPLGESTSGAKTWQYYNMFGFEPLLAIEPHKLRFNRKEAGGPCGNYYWYDVTAPNGTVLDDPASTYVQLVFAGGKQTQSGTDINPFIAQKVSGNQVAIDPTYGLNDSTSTSSGSCSASCLKVSTANVAGQCCSCNGSTLKFARSAWSAVTYVCQ